MTDFYLGQVGIDPNYFWVYTWKEVVLIGESWSIKANLDWEMTRFLATQVLNSRQGVKSANMLSPEKLFPLPQDVYLEKDKPKSTVEQKNAFVERINKSRKGS